MKKPHKEPWKPVVVAEEVVQYRTAGLVSKQDVRAIKNCWAGKATEYEQRIALEALIYSIARASDTTYYPDSMGGERDSAFAQGMRHVGMQVLKLADLGNIYLEDNKQKPE